MGKLEPTPRIECGPVTKVVCLLFLLFLPGSGQPWPPWLGVARHERVNPQGLKSLSQENQGSVHMLASRVTLESDHT